MGKGNKQRGDREAKKPKADKENRTGKLDLPQTAGRRSKAGRKVAVKIADAASKIRPADPGRRLHATALSSDQQAPLCCGTSNTASAAP